MNDTDMTNLDGVDGLELALALYAQDVIEALIEDEGCTPLDALLFAANNPPTEMFKNSDPGISPDMFELIWVKNVIGYCKKFQNL
jgi:hypothetical protein